MLAELDAAKRQAEAVRQLLNWQREARRRARAWDGPAVWDLARSPQRQLVAALLDPSRELQADLNRVCAEAVAAEAGQSLVRGSRPLADRVRLCRPASTS